ncbi:MAG TPA: permease, partial [Coprothermobacter proteolyticus]|nr:permease [Coprothermobacter proteolyticus]
MQVLAAVWSFIQNQILGMKWLSSVVYSVLNALGLDMNTRVGGMIHFFVYDLAKIFLLLSVLIFVISYVQS